MELIIIDLKTNEKVKITDCEQFKNINIGHKISVNYKGEYSNNEYINGIICSIEHKIDQYDESFNYKLIIKVY